MIELRQCKCGAMPKLYWGILTPLVFVECRGCGKSVAGHTEDEVVKLWNGECVNGIQDKPSKSN